MHTTEPFKTQIQYHHTKKLDLCNGSVIHFLRCATAENFFWMRFYQTKVDLGKTRKKNFFSILLG